MQKFLVKGNLGGEGQIKVKSFDTEDEALERAAQLIDENGSRIAVDVWLGENASQPFRDILWVKEWREKKRKKLN